GHRSMHLPAAVKLPLENAHELSAVSDIAAAAARARRAEIRTPFECEVAADGDLFDLQVVVDRHDSLHLLDRPFGVRGIHRPSAYDVAGSWNDDEVVRPLRDDRPQILGHRGGDVVLIQCLDREAIGIEIRVVGHATSYSTCTRSKRTSRSADEMT